MKNTVVLIHGFADFSGRWTTDKFRPLLEKAGFLVKEHDYGFSLAPNLFNNKKESDKLAERNPEFVVAHSNGSIIVQMASWKGLTSKMVVLINPALDTKARFGPGIKNILVLHTPTDLVLLLASWIPFHPWGKMGRVGYEGDDKRVENWNMRHKYDYWDTAVRVKGHLDIFRRIKLIFWGHAFIGYMLVKRVQEERNEGLSYRK